MERFLGKRRLINMNIYIYWYKASVARAQIHFPASDGIVNRNPGQRYIESKRQGYYTKELEQNSGNGVVDSPFSEHDIN